MKKRLLYILFVLNFSITTNAQWVVQNSGTINNLNSVYFVDTTSGYIAGDNGTIIHTSNGGDNWEFQNSGITENLNSVFFTSKDTGYIVGENGKILKSTNGGINWTPQISNTNLSLACVFFSSNDVGYIVGDSGTVLKTINGGSQWVQLFINIGVSNYLTSVYFTSDDNGCIVSYGCPSTKIFNTIDGGANWTAINGTGAIFSVFFVNIDVGYNALWSGEINKTTDGGVNWYTVYPASDSINLFSLYFTDLNTGYAVGNNKKILKTTDAGATWIIQNHDYTYWSCYNSVFFPSHDIGFIAFDGGGILKTYNGGETGVIDFKKNNEGIKLFPNPATDNFTINTSEKGKIVIQNIRGQTISQQQLQQGKTIIDISRLAKGLYILRLYSSDSTEVTKFVKE